MISGKITFYCAQDFSNFNLDYFFDIFLQNNFVLNNFSILSNVYYSKIVSCDFEFDFEYDIYINFSFEINSIVPYNFSKGFYLSNNNIFSFSYDKYIYEFFDEDTFIESIAVCFDGECIYNPNYSDLDIFSDDFFSTCNCNYTNTGILSAYLFYSYDSLFNFFNDELNNILNKQYNVFKYPIFCFIDSFYFRIEPKIYISIFDYKCNCDFSNQLKNIKELLG